MTQHIEHDEWTAAVWRELARNAPATPKRPGWLDIFGMDPDYPLPASAETEERLRATITALANECDRALDLIQQLRLERDAAHAEAAALPHQHWTATP